MVKIFLVSNDYLETSCPGRLGGLMLGDCIGEFIPWLLSEMVVEDASNSSLGSSNAPNTSIDFTYDCGNDESFYSSIEITSGESVHLLQGPRG